MVANKPKPKQTGREPSLPSAKHRLRYDPFAVAKKQANRKAPPKSTSNLSARQSPGITSAGSTSRMPPPQNTTAASTDQRHSQPVQRPSVVFDMTRLTIGASQPASHNVSPAAAIGRAPEVDSKMDVDTNSDAASSSGSSSDSDSSSESDSDRSDAKGAQDADVEKEPLADDSDDEVAKFKFRSNSNSKRLPYKYRTTQFIEPVVRRWPVHRTKYTYDYEQEDISPPAAHRIMQSLLADRSSNVTRQIILRGDMLANGYTSAYPTRHFDILPRNVIQWPAIGIRRYMEHIQLNRLVPMGIDPMRSCKELYTSVGLEEPGEEWDQKQIEFLYGEESADDDNISLEESGYTHGFTPATDGSDIADTKRNGGMGIVVKRQHHASATGLVHTSDDAQFLTYLQIKYPGLAEPRLQRVPLLDAFEGRAPDVLSNYYLPVIDLTRTQVLGQVLKAAQSIGSQPPQLSRFASSSVVEEAVSGVARIWDKISDFWKHRLEVGPDLEVNHRRRLFRPFPGLAKTGWLSVLEAAISSDIPPEVIARCYHRLVKLCDVPVKNEELHLSGLFEKSATLARRRYAPQDDGIKKEDEEEESSIATDAPQGTVEGPVITHSAPRGNTEEPNIVLIIDSDEGDSE